MTVCENESFEGGAAYSNFENESNFECVRVLEEESGGLRTRTRRKDAEGMERSLYNLPR